MSEETCKTCCVECWELIDLCECDYRGNYKGTDDAHEDCNYA